MVWVKLDDKFHSNEKVLEAGYAAAGLYALSLSYCGDHLTDGRVPQAWANQHPKSHRDKLVKSGLWKKSKDGYMIPDFVDLNPTKAEVAEKRARQREGGIKGAQKRWANKNGDGSTHGLTQGGTYAEPKRPDPTRSKSKSLSPSQARSTAKPPATPDTNARPYQCPQCPMAWKTERKLRSHLDHVHWLEGEPLDQAVAHSVREAGTHG